MNTENYIVKSIGSTALVTGLLLLIPLIAKQFSDDMNWTLFDFIVVGFLLFGTGLAYKLITMKSTELLFRVAVGFSLFAGLFLIWSNIAVGIIGSENNQFNVLYFGVISVGIIGAFLARFQPRGLALTLFAMAIIQGIVSVFALFTGMADVPGSSVYEILAVNGFFITLFVVAGMLFRYAEEEQLSADDRSE